MTTGTNRTTGTAMIDEFLLRAFLAGIGVAVVAGPLGCFVVWRRMAYFGDTIAHSALLGVALALLLDWHVMVGVFAVSAAIALALLVLRRVSVLPGDALLGILSHSALAIGLVAVAFLTTVRIDLVGYLFGDILSVGWGDVAMVWIGGAAVLAVLALVWHPLFAATVSEELAAAEGLAPARSRTVFVLLLAAVIAIAMKIVGILLVTSLLIIPAATARRFASGPEVMALIAAGLGALAVASGLAGSLAFDTPSGPSVVVAALALFVASLALGGRTVSAPGSQS